MVTPTIRTRAEGVTEGVLNTLGRAAHQVEDSLDAQGAAIEARLGNMWQQMRRLEASLAQRARDAATQTDGYVRAHPWQTVAAVAAVGLLAGALVSMAASKRRRW